MARKKVANSMDLELDEKTKRLTSPVITYFQIDPIKIDGVENFCIGAYNAANRCMTSIGAITDKVSGYHTFSQQQLEKMTGLVDTDKAGCGFIFDTRENAQKVVKKLITRWNAWQLEEFKYGAPEIQEESCKV